MGYRSLSSLVQHADDLLKMPTDKLATDVLLAHLKSHEGVSGDSVYQHGKISRHNFFNSLTPTNGRERPAYGDKNREVVKALREAWAWLETNGILIPDENAGWFFISKRGMELGSSASTAPRSPGDPMPQSQEELELDVAYWMAQLDPAFTSAGSQREGAIKNRLQRLEHAIKPLIKAPSASNGLPLIADSRLADLRALSSTDFDFRKLIRLCEELNIAYGEKCFFATAMLTRGLLDHVPPIFAQASFNEVANNYNGGKSFRGMMQHLNTGARNVADGHLHMQIRKSETLPTEQQVHFAAGLDTLLAEIVRITK